MNIHLNEHLIICSQCGLEPQRLLSHYVYVSLIACIDSMFNSCGVQSLLVQQVVDQTTCGCKSGGEVQCTTELIIGYDTHSAAMSERKCRGQRKLPIMIRNKCLLCINPTDAMKLNLLAA